MHSIHTNILAMSALRSLNEHHAALASSLEKLSSGHRINRAADDPAGLAVSEKMRADIRSSEVAVRNAQDGISLIRTAEGALHETHAMLNRMVELATRASTGIHSEESRKALDDEFQQLKAEIDRTAKATTFNGKKLLDGSLSKGLGLQIGSTADAYNRINVKVKDMGAAALGLNEWDLSCEKSSLKALEAVKEAINAVSEQRGSLGATENRLGYTIRSLSAYIENLSDAESRIRDTDMAKEMMNFTRSSILAQAAQAMFAHANMLAQSVVSLLR